MPKNASGGRILVRPDPQLQTINEKIAGLASVKPSGTDLYDTFSRAARLAGELREEQAAMRARQQHAAKRANKQTKEKKTSAQKKIGKVSDAN